MNAVDRCSGALGRAARAVQAAIDADAESFNEVMAAFKKAKTIRGAGRVEAATKKATLIPLGVAERARKCGR